MAPARRISALWPRRFVSGESELIVSALSQTELANGAREVAVGFGDLTIDRAAIVAVLGYRDGAMPEHFGEMLDLSLAEAAARCRPKAGYRLVEAAREDGRFDALRLSGTVFNTQKIVAGALRHAEHAAVFAATIGSSLEEWARAALHGEEPALGYIADAVGSAVAEALADRLHDHIAQQMERRGWLITNRYSPGYCNWSVAEQHALFALLPRQFCGITLGESALMQPVKSVSGIIGVGPEVKYSDYLCNVCNMRDCTYRRYHERRNLSLTPNSIIREQKS